MYTDKTFCLMVLIKEHEAAGIKRCLDNLVNSRNHRRGASTIGRRRLSKGDKLLMVATSSFHEVREEVPGQEHEVCTPSEEGIKAAY